MAGNKFQVVIYSEAWWWTLQDYEKPLLDPKCRLISKRSVHMIFHKVRDILQYHNMFNIELSAAVKAWDAEEKIGSVFTASVSHHCRYDYLPHRTTVG